MAQLPFLFSSNYHLLPLDVTNVQRSVLYYLLRARKLLLNTDIRTFSRFYGIFFWGGGDIYIIKQYDR